jgi:hypothetical protein
MTSPLHPPCLLNTDIILLKLNYFLDVPEKVLVLMRGAVNAKVILHSIDSCSKTHL